MPIEGKTALVTGGSKGIGFGIARELIKKSVKVMVTSRNQAEAREAADRLNKLGGAEVVGVQADVRDYPSQEQAVKNLLDKWGQLDILVANAGVGRFGPIETMTHGQWNDTIDTNLTGVFNSVKASLDALIKSKGYIITISSLAGTNFFAGGAAYNASKFGLTGFTQSIMLDLRKHGVKVSTIMPGSVATHFNDHVPDASDGWKIQTEDIGQLVVDLLEMPPRALPSKVEIRPSQPPGK
ncbi:MAG: SDR family oxidoreductase [Cyclobacteriaceae bacterium]|nr:SDR family oxidoreductase [Cyclobacteriaceae bacterium]MCB0499896.1 SDR family oxidoreductase [Cyclobacteriaceae bacterium]MCB9239188.1 SDR family oxidoreductase [Flammeovirgaceae bacterium]MCO5272662.1 SDR family oxidoreductase [Cyclobacteriaceae bacterium]MCW5902791.1 SDR family oxidoreductase [Cyclobacteriaceae bacterium]